MIGCFLLFSHVRSDVIVIDKDVFVNGSFFYINCIYVTWNVLHKFTLYLGLGLLI